MPVIACEVPKEPRATSKSSLTLAKVSVHESTIRRTLNNNGLYGRVVWRKGAKKAVAVCQQSAKDHVDKPESYWKSLWIDEPKIELFGMNKKCYVWRKQNTAFQYSNLVSSVNHGGGSIN